VKRGTKSAAEDGDDPPPPSARAVRVVEKPPQVIESPVVSIATLRPKKAEPEPDEGSFWSDGDDDDEKVVPPLKVAPVIDEDEVVKPNPLVTGRARAVNLTASIRSQAAAIESQKRGHAREEPPPPPPLGDETPPPMPSAVSASDEYGELDGANNPPSTPPSETSGESKRGPKVRRSRFRARGGKVGHGDDE
jgi:hypothetical protein